MTTFAGVQATRTGAFDPTESGTNVIRATLGTTPLAVCGTGMQGHVGPYRVKPRVFAAGTGPVYVRIAARYGGGQLTYGEWKLVPVIGEWCEMDCGVFTPPVAPVGAQGWEARVEAVSETAGDTIDVDYVILIGAGRFAKAKVSAVYESPSSVLASDTFDQTSGTLGGKVIAAAFTVAGPLFPATGVNDASIGTVAWNEPGAISVSDNFRAEAPMVPGPAISKYLKGTKFGFAIPAGATISGIVVEIERSRGSEYVSDQSVKLVKAGAIVGSEHAVVGNWADGTDPIAKFGSETDLWGTTWTVEQINAEGFGAAISAASATGPGGYALVDSMRITVYYVPSGGQTWAESGHEPKYEVDATAHTAKRSGVGDAADTGRFALAGGNEPTTTVVQADAQCSVGTGRTGILARYTSTTAALALVLTGSPYKVQLLRFGAGPSTTVLQRPTAGYPLTKVAGQTVTLRLAVYSDGHWLVWADGLLLGQGYDPLLVEGETLGKGKVGLYDEHNAAAVSVWDNLLVWTPESNPVLWPGRRAKFRWGDALHEDNSGLYWSPIPGGEGARLRIPPAGPANLTSRLTAKARRLNVDENIDLGNGDEVEIKLTVAPRVLLLG
jgi:hypothetical protein